MSIRAFVPGDRDEDAAATQGVAGILAGITLPPIEPFGSDNEALMGLPVRTPCPVPDPEPPSRGSVAFGVHEAGIAALEQLRQFEDSVEATEVRLVAQVCAAAEVQMSAAGLDQWQQKVSGASTVTELALALHIPERTAAILEYHACELVASYPSVLAAMEAGELSYRHAVIMVDESDTLRSTAGITPSDLSVFLAKLLTLVANTTVASFTGEARRARERMHQETITTRTKEAFTKRGITCDPGTDGMSWLTLYMPTVSATAIYTYCTRLALTLKNDAATAHRSAHTGEDSSNGGTGEDGVDLREHRTLDQLRTDIATLLILGQNLPTTARTTATVRTTATSTPTSNTTATEGAGGGAKAPASDTTTGIGAGAAGPTTRRSSFPTPGEGDGGDVEVLLPDDDEEPPWAHAIPENPGNANPATDASTTHGDAGSNLPGSSKTGTPATGTGPAAPVGGATAPAPIASGARFQGTVLPPEVTPCPASCQMTPHQMVRILRRLVMAAALWTGGSTGLLKTRWRSTWRSWKH